MIDPRTAKKEDLQAHGYMIGFTTVTCKTCNGEILFMHPDAIKCFDCAIKSMEKSANAPN